MRTREAGVSGEPLPCARLLGRSAHSQAGLSALSSPSAGRPLHFSVTNPNHGTALQAPIKRAQAQPHGMGQGAPAHVMPPPTFECLGPACSRSGWCCPSSRSSPAGVWGDWVGWWLVGCVGWVGGVGEDQALRGRRGSAGQASHHSRRRVLLNSPSFTLLPRALHAPPLAIHPHE